MVGGSLGRELGNRHEFNTSDLSVASVVRGRDSDDITFRHEHRRLRPRERGCATAFVTAKRSAIEINFTVLLKGTGHIYDHKTDRIGGDCSTGCA